MEIIKQDIISTHIGDYGVSTGMNLDLIFFVNVVFDLKLTGSEIPNY